MVQRYRYRLGCVLVCGLGDGFEAGEEESGAASFTTGPAEAVCKFEFGEATPLAETSAQCQSWAGVMETFESLSGAVKVAVPFELALPRKR